jgi:hypothetical protein
MPQHPDNNPKTRVGALKAPMHLIPPIAEVALAEALADGAEKYGPFNWRSERISTSVYIGAIRRHMAAYQDGEDIAADSGVHHLAHVMACCALVLDAAAIDRLNDDRPPAGGAPQALRAYLERQQDPPATESVADALHRLTPRGDTR